jgi:hypothetical protein
MAPGAVMPCGAAPVSFNSGDYSGQKFCMGPPTVDFPGRGAPLDSCSLLALQMKAHYAGQED